MPKLKHALKFLKVGLLAKPPSTSFKKKCCRDVADNFDANFGLVAGIGVLPGFTYWTAMNWIEAGDEAKRKIVGNHPMPKNPQTIQKIGMLSRELIAQKMNIGRDAQVEYIVECTSTFEDFISYSEYLHGVVEGMLRSIIVQAWGTFEVLAEDLFTESLNQNQASFGFLKGNEKWRFRSRSAVRDCYKTAFPMDNASIKAALDHEAIDALALLRNVLVHKGGRADKEFLNEAKKLSLLAPFYTLREAEPVNLDGEIVLSIVDPAMFASHALIVAVDEWLTTH